MGHICLIVISSCLAKSSPFAHSIESRRLNMLSNNWAVVWSSISDGGDAGYSCSYGMRFPIEKLQELICLSSFKICNEHIFTRNLVAKPHRSCTAAIGRPPRPP